MSGRGAIVLCGGRSSRMGRAKAWLPFGDETLLTRSVRILRESVGTVVVAAAPGQELPELPADVAVVRDRDEGLGPVYGLSAALEALADRVEAVYVTACDAPFLRPAFVQRVLAALAGPDHPLLAVPRVADRFHPLAAAYRTAILPELRRYLIEGGSSLVGLIDRLPSRIIEAHELIDVDPALESLANVNTPDEYAAALRRLIMS